MLPGNIFREEALNVIENLGKCIWSKYCYYLDNMIMNTGKINKAKWRF